MGRREDGGRPGAEISLRREFAAFGSRWAALSAYACEEGLVLDVAREVEPMSLRAFMERHGLGFGGSGREPDRAERLRMEAENPMELELRASVTVNGRELRESGGSGTAWLPLAGAENGAEARRFVERYGLDADYCQTSAASLRLGRPAGDREPHAEARAGTRAPARRALQGPRGRRDCAHPPADRRAVHAEGELG